MRGVRIARGYLACLALLVSSCVRAELLDAGGGGMDAGADASVVVTQCSSHDDCLDSADPDAFVCAERGQGRRCYPSCNEGECAGHPYGVICFADFGSCGCNTNADCPSPFAPLCSPSGFCGECVTDADCGGTTPHCDVDFAYCAECTMNSHCASNDCNRELGVCR
jgi:hypothetical protein